LGMGSFGLPRVTQALVVALERVYVA
jgi:hypothetical protein